MNISFNKSYIGKKEEKAAVKALQTTLGTGDGPYTKKLTQALKDLTKARYVLPVTSCTHGMELALEVMGVGTGDEVILPSFTMSSTANAIVRTGAKPVFVDIDPIHYNIDPEEIKRNITKKTRGIMVVHYAGMPCEMEKIRRMARTHNLFIIEDAAHCIGATYKEKAMGTLSDVGVFSFHGTKNVSCGEGGAVMTNSRVIAEKMEIYRANGTNRNAFLRGEVDKYSWVSEGSSFFLSDILCAIAYIQISRIKTINKKRNQIASFYTKAFQPYSEMAQLPVVPKNTAPNWHIYALTFYDKVKKDAFMSKMRKKGIEVSSHYVPLHTAPMGLELKAHKSSLPVTDNVSRTLVRFPIYPGLTKKELHYIVTSARHILSKL